MKKYINLFGAKPNKNDIQQYEKSENWKNGKFQNLVDTSLSINFWNIPELIYKQLKKSDTRVPQSSLPIIPFDRDTFLKESNRSKFIWYGHSVILMRMNAKTILIDPMFGPDAAPIAPMSSKRFSTDTLKLIDDFPEIDLMLISHDHYDHLDFDSINKLKHKTKKYFVALGIKRHLIHWGIEEHKIQEFDWWDEGSISDISITYTPTRHFSGRGLTDRSKSLWGGWALNNQIENIWFSGDGGFGDHFKVVGDRLGPFDFAFMECGQYNEMWEEIHMFPKQSVQAAIDGKAKKAMPVHWGGFSLAPHSWTEPTEKFVDEATIQKLRISLPNLGEIFEVETDRSMNKWWNKEL